MELEPIYFSLFTDLKYLDEMQQHNSKIGDVEVIEGGWHLKGREYQIKISQNDLTVKLSSQIKWQKVPKELYNNEDKTFQFAKELNIQSYDEILKKIIIWEKYKQNYDSSLVEKSLKYLNDLKIIFDAWFDKFKIEKKELSTDDLKITENIKDIHKDHLKLIKEYFENEIDINVHGDKTKFALFCEKKRITMYKRKINRTPFAKQIWEKILKNKKLDWSYENFLSTMENKSKSIKE